MIDKKYKKLWASFEGRLGQQCLKLDIFERALIHKVDPPSRVVNYGRGEKRIIYLENPFLDFHGTYWQTPGQPRPIVFEAKTTQGKHSLAVSTSLPKPTKSNPMGKDNGSGITYAQLTQLRNWTRFGALTGVIWENDRLVYWLSMATIESTLLGRKSIPIDAGVEVPQNPWPDFLDVAVASEAEVKKKQA